MDLNNTYIYWRWAAEMNFYYAQKHRYDFQYIRSQSYDDPYHNKSLSPERINSLENDGTDGITKTKAHCYLEIPSQNLSVSRGAAWCKLLAIASVLDRGHYSTIVLLDSDMFFQLDAPKISSLIDTYRIDFKNERDNSTTPFTEPTVWFSSNHPWGTYHRNTAMQIWQVNPQQQQHDSRREGHVWKLLRQWWQINKNPQSHAYEQSALWIIAGVWNSSFDFIYNYTRQMKQCHLGLLDLRTMDPSLWTKPTSEPQTRPIISSSRLSQTPVIHVSSDIKQLRQEYMQPPFERFFLHVPCDTLVAKPSNLYTLCG